jgi:Ca2+/Na+ antiporter
VRGFRKIIRSGAMENVIELILSNEIYLLITIGVIIALVFFVLKKMIKLIIYATIILLAFLAYVYYTGESIDTAVEPAKEAIEKAEKNLEENKETQEVKKKIENELKK